MNKFHAAGTNVAQESFRTVYRFTFTEMIKTSALAFCPLLRDFIRCSKHRFDPVYHNVHANRGQPINREQFQQSTFILLLEAMILASFRLIHFSEDTQRGCTLWSTFVQLPWLFAIGVSRGIDCIFEGNFYFLFFIWLLNLILRHRWSLPN